MSRLLGRGQVCSYIGLGSSVRSSIDVASNRGKLTSSGSWSENQMDINDLINQGLYTIRALHRDFRRN